MVERTVRLVLIGASVCVVLLLTLLACLVVASMLYPEVTSWLLGNGFD